MKGILSENSSIVDVVFLHVKRSLLVYIAIFRINIMVLFVHYVHIQTFYYKKNDMAATDLIRFVEFENQLQFSYTAYSQ